MMDTILRVLKTNPLSANPPKWAIERIEAMAKEATKK